MKKTLIFLLLLSVFSAKSQDDYADFYAKREASLKSENGWLNLAGLFWLKEGENTIGGAESNDFVFPHAEASLGKVILQNNQVLYNGQVIFPYSGPKPTVISHQSLRWFIIQRGDKFAIRLRDLEGEYLKAFHGIDHFPADQKWKIKAKFIPTAGKKVTIIDITGRSYQEDSPGLLEFVVDGKTYRLEAGPGETKEDFFVVFGDATNKTSTYGGGRFLDTKGFNADGTVTLDFNKAYNPPCAFTPFATCPLPTKENKLTVAIPAGEKNAGHH
ncbi:MAG: DUF1684 domain-containing protein [Aquirufa sp.]|jgi:uncharacterized protein (DUF1684 family)